MRAAVALAEGGVRPEGEDVRDEIVKLFEVRALSAAAYGPGFAALWETASECIVGGKLMRPRLLLGAFDALSATGSHRAEFREAAVRIAAGVEVLHYSFLLHDDVIDGDLLRRGRPNLIGALLRDHGRAEAEPAEAEPGAIVLDPRSLHWARSSGILMGDMLLSEAHRVFARERLPESMGLRLLDLLDHTITESMVGEHLDVALSDGIIRSNLEAVLEMTRLKTATYTFELPLRAAAILTGSHARTEEAVGEIGKLLGAAFQLQDDLLSAFGEPDDHGKDAFSDLREGKETALIAYARMTDDWPRVEPLIGDPLLGAKEAREIQSRLRDCGAEAFVRSLIADRLRATTDLIAAPESGIPAELSRILTGLLVTIEERRS